MTHARPPLILLRPEPGNAATAERASGTGWRVIRAPHDHVRALAVDWPDPAGFDGLILTSAAAVRAAYTAILDYRALPLACVGAVTAATARNAGLSPTRVGTGGLADLLLPWPLAQTAGARLLWLAGQARQPVPDALAADVVPVAVYAMDALPLHPERWPDAAIVLVHSARAAERLASAVTTEQRGTLDCVAISVAVGDALGSGWRTRRVSVTPDDGAMLACAENLWQKRGP